MLMITLNASSSSTNCDTMPTGETFEVQLVYHWNKRIVNLAACGSSSSRNRMPTTHVPSELTLLLGVCRC